MNLWKAIFEGLQKLNISEEQTKKKEPEKAPVAEPAEPVQEKTPKELATEKGEAYINIDSIEIDKANPRFGSFSLDWNTLFIEKLKDSGYVGESEEAIVDQWFQDVCRHVVLETYEQEQANINVAENVVRYVNRKNIGDGKTEVS